MDRLERMVNVVRRVVEEEGEEVNALARLRRTHVEKKVWPLIRNDPNAREDGYRHVCRKDGEQWPCLVAQAIAEIETKEPK